MLFDFMDQICADVLGVDVDYFIEKIEKTTYKRAELILNALMSEEEEIIKKQ